MYIYIYIYICIRLSNDSVILSWTEYEWVSTSRRAPSAGIAVRLIITTAMLSITWLWYFNTYDWYYSATCMDLEAGAVRGHRRERVRSRCGQGPSPHVKESLYHYITVSLSLSLSISLSIYIYIYITHSMYVCIYIYI